MRSVGSRWLLRSVGITVGGSSRGSDLCKGVPMVQSTGACTREGVGAAAPWHSRGAMKGVLLLLLLVHEGVLIGRVLVLRRRLDT